MRAIDTSIEVELEAVNRELDPGQHLASAASELAEVRRSAQHLLMLASGGEQPFNTSATQVATPSTSRSPADPCTGYEFADILPAGEAGRELRPTTDSLADSSAYAIPGKFRLQLPGFSSALFAAPASMPSETGIGSTLKSVSVLAH